MNDINYSAVIAFLCHELAGPAATALTAAELLGDEGDAEINGLVTDAARRLAAQLKLIRLGFGPPGSPVGGRELARMAAQACEAEPAEWLGGDEPVAPEVASLLAGLCLLAGTARQPLQLTADSVVAPKRLAFDDSITTALHGGGGERGRAAAAAALALRAAALGMRLQVDDAPGVAVRLVVEISPANDAGPEAGDEASPGDAAAAPVDIADGAALEPGDRLAQA